ncbi:hypothetical protein J5N97_011265 [Dioscorea zingiberensis]|uniref:Uncharacterized protein n=1 Tax=Dioscorea zingiberensis TaxID=325984 RepID=A0A9D5HN68_9LILI|nr:hypothetical protein J5N97_011265 [Dioscorea zingiberensis]
MADLENLLLQAAGRTGGTSGRKNNSRPHTRWRQEGSYSDGSDSNDGGNPDNKFTKRKQSQIPLKKRFDPPDQDGRKNWGDGDGDGEGDDRLSGDDSDSAPSVGSDLYKGDEDKDELGKMSELDREMILLERSERVDDYKLKQHLRASSSKMDKKARQETPPPLSSRGSRLPCQVCG